MLLKQAETRELRGAEAGSIFWRRGCPALCGAGAKRLLRTDWTGRMAHERRWIDLVNSSLAGRVTCDRFLEAYTDYRDEQLGVEAQRAMAEHLAACGACRRYDRVLSAGVDLLRSMDLEPPLPVAPGKLARLALDADLEARTALPVVFRRPMATVMALAAAVFAAIALFPGGPRSTPELDLPAVVAAEPAALFKAGPGIQRVPVRLPYEMVPTGFQTISRSLLYQYGRPVAPRAAVARP